MSEKSEKIVTGKQGLIDHLAKEMTLSKEVATKTLSVLLAGIRRLLKEEKQIRLMGFGTFEIKHKKASTLKNVRTGEPMDIPAYKTPVFKASKELKKSINE